MCAGLVTLDESDYVRLVHYTVMDFFTSHRDQWFPEGAFKLTSACLTYLSFDAFKTGACSGLSESADFDAGLVSYPFLGYAAEHWGKHLLETPSEELYNQARLLLTDRNYFEAVSQALYYLDDEDSSSWSGKSGSSALHLASHFNLNKLVTDLIEVGLDPNSRDDNGSTPLVLAAMRGSWDAASTLIQAGADVNAPDKVGDTPLHAAVFFHDEKMVNLLLQCKDLDVNPLNTRYTPLMLATMYGYTEITKMLLEEPRLQINKRDTLAGLSALIIAADGNQLDAVQMLLSHPEIDINLQENTSGNTALVYSAQRGHDGVVEKLLARGADMEVLQYKTNDTALIRAVDYGHASIVQTLLEHGADHHRKDYLGRGMLHSAAASGQPEVLRVLLEFDETLDVNMQDRKGKTTLHDTARHDLAEEDSSIDAAKILLEYGADPTIKDNHGRTPMSIARELNNLALLELLREARQKQKEQNRANRASESGVTNTGTMMRSPTRTDTEISDHLQSIWALASLKLIDELRIRLPNATPDELNLKDPDIESTALHYAATNGSVEIAILLINHGADLNLPNVHGRTPLHLTAIYDNPEVAEVLLEAGVEVNTKDHWEETPLNTSNYYDGIMCPMLIERGADLPTEPSTLNNMLRIAARFGNEGAVRRLVAAGAEAWRKDLNGMAAFAVAKYFGYEKVADLIFELSQSSESRASTDWETTLRENLLVDTQPTDKARKAAQP